MGFNTIITEAKKRLDFQDVVSLDSWKEWSYVKGAAILVALSLMFIPTADAVDALKTCSCLLKECRKSGQIPAFGDWENANDLPITQYFECARQAGLLRCSCSGECGGAAAAAGDLYGVGFEKPLPRRDYAFPQRKARGNNKGNQYYPKSQQKKVKLRELTDQPRDRDQKQHYPRPSTKSVNNLVSHKTSINVKPVDEDLYKIPSELLENSKRKKMLGFFSRCMVPPCAA